MYCSNQSPIVTTSAALSLRARLRDWALVRATDVRHYHKLQRNAHFSTFSENRPNHVIVRVFLPYEVEEYQNTTSLTYDYYEPGSQVKHSVLIEFSAESGDSAEIKFTYTSPGSTVSQDIKISAIEVYLWYVNNDSPPSWVAFNARGDDKYNVVLDYIQRKTDLGSDTHSLFETWTQSFEF